MSEHTKSNRNKIEEIPQETFTSRREERRARRTLRRSDRYTGGWGWLGGALLIALGMLFLLQNAGYFTEFANWWALFLLLPAAGSLSAAVGAYRRDGGEWTKQAIGPLLAGLLFLALMVAFLFSLDLSLFGPVLLIGAGLLFMFGPR